MGQNTPPLLKLKIGYGCPACEKEFERGFQVKDHHRSVHGGTPGDDKIKQITATVEKQPLLEHIYDISTHAGKYASLASKNYNKGKKASARQNSIKKSALYDLKGDILSRLVDSALPDKAAIHKINGREYHYLEYDTWGFHCPTETWAGPSLSSDGQPKKIEDFEKSTEKKRTGNSLKSALTFFNDELGISANEFLEQKYVSYGTKSYFAGWKYLD